MRFNLQYFGKESIGALRQNTFVKKIPFSRRILSPVDSLWFIPTQAETQEQAEFTTTGLFTASQETQPDGQTAPDLLQVINRYLTSTIITTPPIQDKVLTLHNDNSNTNSFSTLQRFDPDACKHLNHSSILTLLDHQEKLNFALSQNIGALNNKRLNYPTRYPYNNYFEQCSLIAMLDQSVARTICFCGLKPSQCHCTNPTGLCNKPRLCWPCSHRNARKTIKTFGPNFYQHQWGFLTISYHGSLPLHHLSGSEWWLHWDAAKSALKRLVETKNVDGAMWREELAILSLLPTTVLPHLHAILPTDCLSGAAIECLTSWTMGHRDDIGNGIQLAPSIDFKPLATQDDFDRVAHYLHKPIDLVTPYQSRWNDLAPLDEKVAINREMRDLTEAILYHSWRRSQVGYYGNMRASSRSTFIGVPLGSR